jgi:pilus assembly protein CpaB
MNIRKIVTGVVIALVISGSLVFVLYKKIQAGDTRSAKVAHVWHYYAATKNISTGESLSSAMMAPVDWDSPVPVNGALTSSDDAVGRIAAYPISKGLILTNESLAAPGSSFGLPQKIPDGMRAVAIKTDEVADLGGFVFPGSRVDLLLTLGGGSPGGGGGGDTRTIVVLEDVVVLATGKQMEAAPSDKPSPVSVISLLVSADDARKVALAQQQGSLHLTMRNTADRGTALTKVTYLSEVTGSVAPRRPSKPTPKPQTPKEPETQKLEMRLGSTSFTRMYRDNSPVGESSSALAVGGNRK